jgi:hypothetical protein
LLINNFLEILEIFSPPQLVPSGLTTGASSTCRRIGSEGMSLSDIAITFSVSMTISYWHPEFLALNISLVTAKKFLSPFKFLHAYVSDFARHLLKSSHDRI